MKAWKYGFLFYVGGSAYMTLELLFRGRSYGSMFLAGGVCFLLIGHLGKVHPGLSPALRMTVGAGIITLVELGAGLLVNRNFRVWDYRDQWGNFLGQICPVFSLLWIPAALGAMILYDTLECSIERKMSPA